MPEHAKIIFQALPIVSIWLCLICSFRYSLKENWTRSAITTISSWVFAELLCRIITLPSDVLNSILQLYLATIISTLVYLHHNQSNRNVKRIILHATITPVVASLLSIVLSMLYGFIIYALNGFSPPVDLGVN